MRTYLYRAIVHLSKIIGTWVFLVFAWIVATGFFMLFPMRVNNSIRFYQALFPGRSWFYHLGCAWSQFHNFTDVFFDRFMLQEFDDLHYTSEGMEYLEQTLQKKKRRYSFDVACWELGGGCSPFEAEPSGQESAPVYGGKA